MKARPFLHSTQNTIWNFGATQSKIILLLISVLFFIIQLSSAVAQQGNYKPDSKTLRQIENTEKNYISKKDILHICALEQIAILAKANESAEVTARAAKSMCSRQWLVASDAFGDLINARFSASHGQRIDNYVPIFEQNMMDDFRALVLRYRGMNR